MRILVATDAWSPLVNGVVRTIRSTIEELEALGHDVRLIHQGLGFRSIPTPTYPEIRLALLPDRKVGRMIEAHEPDAIHILTEGPIGMATRRWCLRRGVPFTTSYCTKYPEYINARFHTPIWLGYWWFRRFHSPATACTVNTRTQQEELVKHRFENTVLWTRGVDGDLFRPDASTAGLPELPRPVYGYAGRIAVEKNLEAFLDLELDGSKIVVGDGPLLAELKERYPEVRFVGMQHGEDLAAWYAAMDVFVFPSMTETFGLVMLEAMASGVPVAALPVTGPKDVITDPSAGVLDEDLGEAVRRAAELDPADCRAFAEQFTWRRVAEVLLEVLVPIPKGLRRVGWEPLGEKA